MAQGSADDGDRDILVSCCRCPGVTSYIKGEFAFNVEFLAYLLEVVGDTGFCIMIQAQFFLLLIDGFV